jgi:hypothetical protein
MAEKKERIAATPDGLRRKITGERGRYWLCDGVQVRKSRASIEDGEAAQTVRKPKKARNTAAKKAETQAKEREPVKEEPTEERPRVIDQEARGE